MLLSGPFPHAALLNSGYNTREEKHGEARISARICDCAYGRGVVSVDDFCAAAIRRSTRTKDPRFQSRGAAEGNRVAANYWQGPSVGQERSLSLPVACLAISCESHQYYCATAL